MNETVEAPSTKRAKAPKAAHLYCRHCRSRRAKCGHIRPVDFDTLPPMGSEGSQRCVVCLDLQTTPCPSCGRRERAS